MRAVSGHYYAHEKSYRDEELGSESVTCGESGRWGLGPGSLRTRQKLCPLHRGSPPSPQTGSSPSLFHISPLPPSRQPDPKPRCHSTLALSHSLNGSRSGREPQGLHLQMHREPAGSLPPLPCRPQLVPPQVPRSSPPGTTARGTQHAPSLLQTSKGSHLAQTTARVLMVAPSSCIPDTQSLCRLTFSPHSSCSSPSGFLMSLQHLPPPPLALGVLLPQIHMAHTNPYFRPLLIGQGHSAHGPLCFKLQTSPQPAPPPPDFVSLTS